MFEFIKKDDMIYSVEGFWEVKKNTYGKFTSVRRCSWKKRFRNFSDLIFGDSVKEYLLCKGTIKNTTEWSWRLYTPC